MTTPTGRALDRLVAEALGWRDLQEVTDRVGTFLRGKPDWWLPRMSLQPVPLFSERVQEAWQCVEWMEERHGLRSHNGFLLTKRVDDETPEIDLWYCVFGDPVWASGVGETAAEAICRAFLDAVGSDFTLPAMTEPKP